MTLGAALGTLPVLAFLGALRWLDSYRLLPLRRLAGLLGLGAAAAIVCFPINSTLFALVPWHDAVGAPLLEETVKAAVVCECVRRRRVVFLVDAAVAGFAVGAGFALVENLAYARMLSNAGALVFVLRGFGTAVMHGGATALVGIGLRSAHSRWKGLAAGLLPASALHMLYNSGAVSPPLAAAAILLAVPLLLAVALDRGEAALRRWLGEGFDAEVSLLAMVVGGSFLETPAGCYLKELQSRFPPLVAADMLSLVQLSLELSIRAKGELLRREAGFAPSPDPEVADRLREIEYLERSIGVAARRVLAPLPGAGKRAWQLDLLRRDFKGPSGNGDDCGPRPRGRLPR